MKADRIIIIIALSILAVFGSCVKQIPEKPNILFITTDYQAWEDVPDLTPVLNMPVLDRLYREGLVFENHYCTAPVCIPSRYSIVTGTYPHTHGAWDNTNKWVPEGSPILMEELVGAGYKTIGIGKMHFKPWERMAGFDERIIADCQGNWYRDTTKRDDYYYYLKGAGFTRFDYLRYQDSTDLFGVYDWPLADSLDIDYYVGDKTVKYIEEGNLSDQPWFMWVSFNGPHNPWDPPSEIMDYYLERDLPKARFIPGELDNKPFAHTITRYNYTRKVVDQIDRYPEDREEYIKRIRAGHYGGLTWIDNQLQKIFDTLEENGKLENTIVIFTSDHGAHLGDHDLIHKGTHYERSSHVPFVIWWPEVLKAGKVNGFSSHVDIFPSLIDLAGGELPQGLEGNSFIPVIEGKEEASDRAFIEILGNTAIVTEDYKFGLYRQFKEADLYDLKKDPNEYNNLIDDPAYTDVVKKLTDYLYDFDPKLQAQYEQAPEIKKLPQSISFKHGDIISGKEAPYLGEKGFKINISFSCDNIDSGPLFSNYEGQHGFALYLHNSELKIAFKKWNEVQIIELGKCSSANHKVEINVSADGLMEATSDLKEGIIRKEVIWPKPIQPGRKEYLTGTFCAGVYGPNWNLPIAEYNRGEDFTGKIIEIEFQIINK